MAIGDVFSVIAEPTRRQILVILREGDKAVGQLVADLQVSQPTVSKHLKVLREAGLVSMKAQGQKRYYSLVAGPLSEVQQWLSDFGFASTLPGLAAEVPPNMRRDASQFELDMSAHALTPAVTADLDTAPIVAAGRLPIGRTMGKAAGRAADLLSQFKRRRDAGDSTQ